MRIRHLVLHCLNIHVLCWQLDSTVKPYYPLDLVLTPLADIYIVYVQLGILRISPVTAHSCLVAS